MSLFNPLALARLVGRAYNKLNGPAPLDEYPDYDTYWKNRVREGRTSKVLDRHELIAKLLPEAASVLDVGCGDGTFGQHLASVRPDCTFYGLDVSSASVELARSKGLAAAVLDPCKTLREQVDRQFDVVTIMEVLEHVHDAEALFRSLQSLGTRSIVVTIPNVGFWGHRMRLALFGRFPVTTIIFHMKEHIRFWTYKDFAQWVALFGMRIEAFHGQKGTGSRLNDVFATRFPALFASQVIYVLRPCDDKASGRPAE
jgi:methionine biosynthesis protein MetW